MVHQTFAYSMIPSFRTRQMSNHRRHIDAYFMNESSGLRCSLGSNALRGVEWSTVLCCWAMMVLVVLVVNNCVRKWWTYTEWICCGGHCTQKFNCELAIALSTNKCASNCTSTLSAVLTNCIIQTQEVRGRGAGLRIRPETSQPEGKTSSTGFPSSSKRHCTSTTYGCLWTQFWKGMELRSAEQS